jgi:uncharacterized membrane protein YedE/YeeE
MGLLIGLIFGLIASRTHFCTMGALSDFFLFRSTRRLRGLAAATVTAMAGTCLLALAGLPVAGREAAEMPWLAALAGPFAFGVGMTLTGGCITRNLVRAGHGSLKAAITLVLAALATLAVTGGMLALPAAWLRAPSLHLAVPPAWMVPIGLLVAAAGAAWVLLPARQRARAATEIATGVGLGLLVPLWHVLIGPQAYPVMPSFILPNADLARLALAGDAPLTGVAFVVGTLAGAAANGVARRSFRFEGFVDGADLKRHVLGALLMGAGGGVIGMCSFGLAVSGSAALLPAAIVGTAAMALGCRQALRVLEGRSFFSR